MQLTTRVRSLLRKPVTWVALTAAVLVLAVGLALFQPWKLWTDAVVDEALPQQVPAAAVTPAAPSSSPPPSSAGPAPTTPRAKAPAGSTAPPAPAGPVVLAQGTLISHEHPTTGTVRVLQLPDGSRYLRLENLDTSNGPLLKVWLTDAPVRPGADGWRVFDDGRYVDLGALKGNKGSQNYPIPASVRLTDYTSVSIWCARFTVSFGAAELTAA
jgi:hypothetical protein